MTPDELLAAAEQREREADQKRREARALRRAAKALTQSRVELQTESTRMPATEVSTQPSGPGTRRGKAQPASARSAIGQKNRTSDTAFSRWLTANGSSASQWAEQHRDPATGKKRWSASAVRGWMQPVGAAGARRVPEEAAILIERESASDGGPPAVPADLTSWPTGITRPR